MKKPDFMNFQNKKEYKLIQPIKSSDYKLYQKNFYNMPPKKK